jgi:coenzyme F420-reducing hydrogenase alpha subunit
MPTFTFPISRIEGHAQVVIEVQHGKVVSSHFQATELRGFSYFVQGTPSEQMPVIVPRICGVCSTAHHVCSVKTLEDIFDVTPPPLARKIRELLLLGQIVQNQATSLFIFTMPDRLGVESIFQVDEKERKLNESSGIALKSLQVRKTGSELITLAGGQFIHPVKAIIGGVTSGIDPEAAEKMKTQIQAILPVACELFDHYWELSIAMGERIGSWGDDEPAHYITAIQDECPNFDSDDICVMEPDGSHCERFSAHQLFDKLDLEESDYSYAGESTYKGQVLRANSLARINMVRRLGTPHADEYLARFRSAFGKPAHAIMLFDLARGIELVYALERANEILSTRLEGEDVDVAYHPIDGEGYGLVEAPRGPLIHHYLIEKGLIRKADFIIPTVHNMRAISRALTVAARRYITEEKVDMELEKAVGRVVRAFDPCIACATH